MNVAQLTIEMAANVARLKTDMAAARNTVEGTMNSIKKAAGAAQVALGAIGVGLSAAAFANWIKGAINAADEANKLSQKIGITVKEIGGLQLAFKQGGVDADTMQKALAKLNVGIASGDSAFKALGISTKNTDGSLRSTSMVLADVADRFAGTQDGAAKTAMAIDLFGKSGAALIPVLNAGGDSIREFQALAEQLGLTLSSETAAAAEKFNDTLELISMGSRGIANQVMAELLPTLQTLAGEFLNLMTQGGNLKGVADVISAGLKGMFTVAAVGVEIFRTLGNTIGATAAGIVAFASGDFKGAVTIIGELGKDIRTNWTGTLESLDRLWNQSGNTAIEAAAKITKGSLGSAAATEEAAKAAKKLAEEHTKAVIAANDLVASIRFEAETMQMSNLEREIANNLLKLEKTGLEQNTEEYRAYAEAIRLATIENEGIKQRIKLEKDAAEQRKKIEEDYAKEIEQINFQIGQSLTDALINGGQTAKEFLINMFKTLILRPILQPIITGGTSMVMGALGMGASGSAMATPGSLSNTAGLGQIGSLASTMNTLYTGIAGGFTAISSAIGGGLASLASATGSTGLASFAAGMQGASLAPGLAGPTTAGATGAMGAGATAAAFTQGAAGIGAGILAGEYISGGKSLIGGNSLWTTGGGAAAGAAIGTAVLPGIGTAIGGLIGGIVGGIANAGWGSGAKEMQGSGMARGTITGSGLQGAEFYQNWKKAGGWFTSDKYGQDTSAMSAELVTYINDASKAIRDSGKDYATLLQLSADGIDAVALSFDFAVGSMDQLTENLGNTLDDYANKVADAILAGTNFGKAGETSYETIQRLVNSLNLVNPIFDTLGIKMFDMSAAGGAAASAFIDLMGGIDAFNESTEFYYQNFYTQAERTAKTTENLTKIFEEMNLTLPQTRMEFRAMVEAARSAGDNILLANLLKLAPTFSSISKTIEDQIQNAEKLVVIDTAAAEIERKRNILREAEIRQIEQQAQAYNDLISKNQEYKKNLYDLIYDENEARQNNIELLGQQVAAMEDENGMIKDSVDGGLYGAMKAQLVLLSTIQMIVNARQRLEKANQDADRALARHIENIKAAQNQRLESLRSEYETRKATLENSIDLTSTGIGALNDLFDVLQGSINDLLNSTNPEAAARLGSNFIDAALASVQQGGALPTAESLKTAISQAQLGLGAESFGSSFEMRRANMQLAGKLTTLQYETSMQLSTQEKQLVILQEQLTQAEVQYEEQIKQTTEYYDATIRLAEDQLNALRGIDSTMQSVDESVSTFSDALKELYSSMTNVALAEQVGKNLLTFGYANPYANMAAYQQMYQSNAQYAQMLAGFGQIQQPSFFADGGVASGLAVVGENGPELVNFENPAMVYTTRQSSDLLAGNAEVAQEIRQLREENRTQARAVVNLQNRMARLFDKWDGDGLPETRVVTA